jgi:NADPH2:quinone reductase
VVDYRRQDVVEEVRRISPRGADTVVEVAPAQNGALDARVVAQGGSVAVYANNGGDEVALPVRALMNTNARWQFVLVYDEPARAKALAIEDVAAAVLDGAVGVGEQHGLPLHHYPLERTAEAQRAVERGVTGKVLVDVRDDGSAADPAGR